MTFEWTEVPIADFAVIGNPVSHSLSPKMHQAIYDALGLPYRYVAVRVDAGKVFEALNWLAEVGYRGVNVTVPHKREVLHWATTAEPFSVEVQAANTVNLRSRECMNTDAPGFLQTLGGFDFPHRNALVLGAGGSARALVAALSAEDWKIRIYNRTQSVGEELAERYRAESVSNADPEGASLILNTTSAAFDGVGPPVQWHRADPAAVAYDLMYAPSGTPFLREAQSQGLRTIDGLPLLVSQGALSFEWWTGLKAPLDAMLQAVQWAN